jgi:hypothetical protein
MLLISMGDLLVSGRRAIPGRNAMTVCRALAVVAILAVLPVHVAVAQFGGMPGMPGSGGTGGGFGSPGGGFGGPPAGPPPACQTLLTLRDETQKSANAINTASKRKAAPAEACKLFKNFLAAETKMIKAVEDLGATCGVPPEAPKQMKAGHAKAQQIAKTVCDVAEQGPRQAGPSLSDTLGVTPTVPDSQKRGGTFDTMTGNALSR